MANLLPNTLEVQIVRMVKALYDAAPGYTYLNALKGMGTEAAVSTFLNGQFSSLSTAAWAQLIANNLHLTGSASTQAQAFLVSQVNAGFTRAQVLPSAMQGLATLESDPTFGASALYFNNSIATSYGYSINPANTSTDIAGVLRLADEPNSAPVAVADSNAATEGGASIAGTVAANDTDAEGDALTFSPAPTQPPVAGLTFSANGTYLFDPTNAAYDSIAAGATRAVTFNYWVTDGEFNTPGTLTITVTGTNDGPVAHAVSGSGAEDAAKIEVTPHSVDIDVGDSATYAVVTGPSNGTVTFNSGTGKFDYVPNANFNGSDTFLYRVTDGSGATSTALASVSVSAVNDAPVANASSAAGTEDTPIGGTVTGSDIEGSALSFAVATGPANGTVVLQTNGSYVYTPVANFNGSDSFTFTASDGLATSAPKTVSITVGAVNDAPVAAAVTATGAEDSASIAVTPASSDVDAGDTVAYSVVSQPAHGTVSLSSATGKFDYVPNANFNGTDTFVYRATDAAGASSTATATVTVTGVNDAPTAVVAVANVSGDEGTAIAGVVTATDIDGDALSYTITAQPAHGTVTIDAVTGAFVYTGNAGYVGSDEFMWSAADGKGGTSAPAKVAVSLTDTPDVLTTGVDSIVLSGSVGQVVLGNENTYNSGDSIVGGDGNDILRLQLDPDFGVVNGLTVSSANVSKIETVQVSSNPTHPSWETVELLMTNVSTDMTSLEINKSTAEYLSIRDIQAGATLPVVKINDVGAYLTIDFDNTDVTGSADLLKVELNEFGTLSSSDYGRSDLDIDTAIETLEITDKATNGALASDIGLLTGGFTNLNVKGGTAGVPLTFSGASGNSGALSGGFANGVALLTVDSTAFAGNLVADVDGADTVLAGPGNDTLTGQNTNTAGLLSGGAGNDTIALQNTAGPTIANLSGTIQGGAGNDSISVGGSLTNSGAPVKGALIDAGDDNDSVGIGGSVSSLSSVFGGAGNDSITVGTGVFGLVDGGTGNDTLTVTSGGVALGGVVQGGEGNDSITSTGTVTGSLLGGGGDDSITSTGTLGDNSVVTSPAARGVIDGGDGNDTITQTGTVSEGAVINGGAGDDTMTVAGNIEGNLVDALTPPVNNYQTAAAVNGGDGNDRLTIASGTFDGRVNMGAGDDAVTIRSAVVDGTGAVDLGDGNDSITLQNRSWTAADADGLGNDDAIAGGAGTDSMTMESTSLASTTPAQTVTINFAASLATNGTVRVNFLNGVTAVQVPVANVGTDLAATMAALAAALNANATVNAYWSANATATTVVLTTLAVGSGAPVVTFVNAESVTESGVTQETDTGPIVGGVSAGSDSSWSITTDGVGTDLIDDIDDATDITGIESLNLNSADGYNGDENASVAGVQDNEWDHNFNVRLEAFDSALSTINVLERDDSSTVNLWGYASEQINIDSDGRSKVAGDADDVDSHDVFLNINDTQGAAARAANVALNGTVGYLVQIVDDVRISTMNLAVNGTGNRTVTLDSSDQDNNGATAGEGNTLNITGDNTGTLTVTGIYQETVNGGSFNGNQLLTVANDGDPAGGEIMTITTGAGNDVINTVADRLTYLIDIATGAVSGDSINAGAGTDRIIIAHSTNTAGNSIDQDYLFKRITSVEEVEARGNAGGTLVVSLENDANLTGVRKFVASNNAGTRGNINLNIESDFAIGGVPPPITVDVESSNLSIDNGANSNMTVNVQAAKASAGGAASGVYLSFVSQNGTGSGVVDVNVTINGTGTTNIGGLNDWPFGVSASTGPGVATPLSASIAGHVIIDTQVGTIDSLTLVDNGTTDNAVNVTWNDVWAAGATGFVVNMPLANNDPSSPDPSPGLATGGVNFVGAAEDDTSFNITGSANNDTIWGSQLGDTIAAGGGNDFVNADPALGIVVAPGQDMYKVLTFDLTQTIEAGDRVAVTIGVRTYTWTAPAAADGLSLGASSALADLATAITSGGVTANVTESGNIDDGNNEDDVTAFVSGDGLYVYGIGTDVNFGYSLGEEFGYVTALNAVNMNRPTAVVDLAGVGALDNGDVVTINVNGTPYSATVGAGSVFGGINGILDSASELAAALAGAVNGGVLMTAAASGTQVTLRGNAASTSYTVTPSWTLDQLTTPATSKTVAMSYTAPGVGDSVSATFAGGITVSSTTVAGLAAAINANGTLAPQWTAVAIGNNITLTADVAGASAPTNDFVSVDFNGSGTASSTSTAGTNAVVRTDNTDPTLAARQVSFTLSDSWYDGGDQVVVTINGTPFAVALPGLAAEADVDHSASVAAAAAAGSLNALFVGPWAGYSASASLGTITVTAPAGAALPTWAVGLTDINGTPATAGGTLGAVSEIVDVGYSTFVDALNDNYTASMTIGGATYTGDTMAALITAINGGTGTHGYTATPNGPLTIRLTSPAAGLEPASTNDNTQITGTLQNNGGVVAPVSDAGSFAVQRIETVDFTGFTLADGAGVTVGATTYFTIDRGTAAQTLTYLVGLINADTATHKYTAVVTDGDTITLTGPAVPEGGNANPVGASAAEVYADGGDVDNAAPTAGVAAVPEKYTATAAGFDAPTDSVSVTFDTDGTAGLSIGDLSLSGNTWAALAATINAAIGAPGGLLAANISSAVATGSSVIINGPADGVSLNATPPIAASFAGTGGPASIAFTAAGAGATQWSQVVNVVTADAGDRVYVYLTDGTLITQDWDTDEATTLGLLGDQLQTALGFNTADDVVNTGADTITLFGPLDGSNPPSGKVPATTGIEGDILVIPATAGVVTPVVVGVAADAYDVSIDFTDITTDAPPPLKVSEVAEVILAGNIRYSATSVAALAALINSGSATLPATGPNAASILGHGWTAAAVGNTLTLTGPTNGTAPNILFDSARLVETQAASPSEIQESWHNLDNTNPTLTVTSGAANVAPTPGTFITGTAAATSGANGNDSVTGGDGNDTINGWGGNDTLYGDGGNDMLSGGDGNDQTWGGAGNDWASGGAGNDTMVGAEGNDTLLGGTGADNIDGGDGPDRLEASDGNDTVAGGAGDDFIRGGAGRDNLTGGDGTDVFYFSAGGLSESQGAISFADVVTDFVVGVDKFQFDFIVNFYANVTNTTSLLAGLTDVSPAAGPLAGRAIYDSSAKILYVDANGDGAITASDDLVLDLTQTSVAGLSIADFINTGVLTGTASNDLLIGTGGGDIMSGGDGDDTLFGGTGADALTGGNGSDTFHFASTGDATNTIADFVSGVDKLQFTDTAVSFAGNVSVLGTSLSASPAVGKAVLVGSVLNVDVDGNGFPDVLLTLTGVTSLSAGDFLAPEPAPGL